MCSVASIDRARWRTVFNAVFESEASGAIAQMPEALFGLSVKTTSRNPTNSTLKPLFPPETPTDPPGTESKQTKAGRLSEEEPLGAPFLIYLTQISTPTPAIVQPALCPIHDEHVSVRRACVCVCVPLVFNPM